MIVCTCVTVARTLLGVYEENYKLSKMLRERIVAFYSKHNPKKLEQKNFPDRLIAAFKREGRLGTLMAEMCAKYGYTEDEWVMLQSFPKRDTSVAVSDQTVDDNINCTTNVKNTRSPHSQALLLSAPPVVVKTGRCDKQTQTPGYFAN